MDRRGESDEDRKQTVRTGVRSMMNTTKKFSRGDVVTHHGEYLTIVNVHQTNESHTLREQTVAIRGGEP